MLQGQMGACVSTTSLAAEDPVGMDAATSQPPQTQLEAVDEPETMYSRFSRRDQANIDLALFEGSIFETIAAHLDSSDLYNASLVSTSWRGAVRQLGKVRPVLFKGWVLCHELGDVVRDLELSCCAGHLTDNMLHYLGRLQNLQSLTVHTGSTVTGKGTCSA